MCQNTLVPALDAGLQKNRPYQSVAYMVGFNAIPRQAREQDSFDTPPRLNTLYIFVIPDYSEYQPFLPSPGDRSFLRTMCLPKQTTSG